MFHTRFIAHMYCELNCVRGHAAETITEDFDNVVSRLYEIANGEVRYDDSQRLITIARLLHCTEVFTGFITDILLTNHLQEEEQSIKQITRVLGLLRIYLSRRGRNPADICEFLYGVIQKSGREVL